MNQAKAEEQAKAIRASGSSEDNNVVVTPPPDAPRDGPLPGDDYFPTGEKPILHIPGSTNDKMQPMHKYSKTNLPA
jgi:hypothetical protein